VARSLGESRGVPPVCVPVAPEDFHGDGVGSKVCIIRSDRLLERCLDSSLAEPLLEQQLVGRYVSLATLLGERNLTPVLEGLWLAATCGVGGFGIPLPLFGRALRGEEPVCLGRAASRNASPVEEVFHGPAADAVALCERIGGFAGQVTLDQVLRVRRRPFRGHVFNLQTRPGWYIANGIIVHNCRCYTVPVAEPPDQFVDRLREWLDNPASHPDIEGWYRRFEAQLRGTFRRSAPTVAVPPEDRFWQNAAVRLHRIWELAQAFKSGDQAAIAAAVKAIDDQVVDALRREALPRGPVAKLRVAYEWEDPGLEKTYGYKAPSCDIGINREMVERIIAGNLAPEKLLHTWLHESIHARQPFSPFAMMEYNRAPGFEEGVTDGLARRLIRRLTGWVNPERHSYDNFVNAMEGLALALDEDPEQFLRRLWQNPTGRVADAVYEMIAERYGVQMGSKKVVPYKYWRDIERPFEWYSMVGSVQTVEYWRDWF